LIKPECDSLKNYGINTRNSKNRIIIKSQGPVFMGILALVFSGTQIANSIISTDGGRGMFKDGYLITEII